MVPKKTPKTAKKEEFSQPVVSVGLVGHVDNGKTTLLERLSGVWADTHSEEKKRGITIKLGYADITIFTCPDHSFTGKPCCDKATPLRAISFVDAPGHETLMATMLSGAAIMDGALLLVAANEECPQPQTREHLMALELIGIKNIIIVQNKIDLVTREEALANYNQIRTFVKGTIAENAPIIPVSAIHRVNLNYIYEAIEEYIPTTSRDPAKESLFFIARSFDVNKPGTPIKNLIGGVFGGSLKQGVLHVGEKIEISPGHMISEHGVDHWIPYTTEITSLRTARGPIKEAHPGGSVALATLLDPAVVKSDQLAGAVIGHPAKLPSVWTELIFEPLLLQRVVGTKEELTVEQIKRGEPLMLNVNAATTAGIVTSLEKKKVIVKLKRPVCASEGDKIAISRRIGNRWRLIGTALIKK